MCVCKLLYKKKIIYSKKISAKVKKVNSGLDLYS